MPASRTHAERSEATTGQLLDVARQQFTELGYAAASIEGIVRAAGVTRGALYHHFDTKADVFRAVFEQEEAALAARLSEATADEPDALRRLQTGCRLFLEGCRDPHVRQILLLDGPAVLGWDTVREIEGRYTMAMLRGALRAAVDTGRMRPGDVEARTNLLMGALCHGGMWLARHGSSDEAVRVMTREVDLLLAGLES